jgi:hypothetical protein
MQHLDYSPFDMAHPYDPLVEIKTKLLYIIYKNGCRIFSYFAAVA